MNQECPSCGSKAVWWNSIRRLTHCHHCGWEPRPGSREEKLLLEIFGKGD